MPIPFHVTGDIFIDVAPDTAFQNATVYVRLCDTTRADASSHTITETVIDNVSHEPGSAIPLKVTLTGQLPDGNARYTIAVHIDVDRDGQVSQGDFITMESYPVLTQGYPAHVSVRVRQVP